MGLAALRHPVNRFGGVGACFAPILTMRRKKELSIPQTAHDKSVAISIGRNILLERPCGCLLKSAHFC